MPLHLGGERHRLATAGEEERVGVGAFDHEQGGDHPGQPTKVGIYQVAWRRVGERQSEDTDPLPAA